MLKLQIHSRMAENKWMQMVKVKVKV